MPLERNQVLETTIEGIGINGEGIARVDNMAVFIPYTLPGERVHVKIVSVKKDFAYGKLIDIITPADERAREECPVFSKCGGCQIQHLKYKDQLAFKTIVVRDTFRKVGGIVYNIPQTYKSEHKYGYRNKLQLPVGKDSDKPTPLIGFYANNSHRIVGINSCPLHPEWNEKLISVIKRFMGKYFIMGYDEETGKGTIRHIVARSIGKVLQIIIVIATDRLPEQEQLVEMLNQTFEKPSIFVNVNREDTNVILGDSFTLLSGDFELETIDMGHHVVVSPSSFMQINDFVKTKMYNKAVEVGEISENDIVIDAYCGIGVLTAMFAEKAKFTYGVEIVPQAIENANKMVDKNMLSHKLKFILGDCKDELDVLLANAKRLTGGDTILVIDPPRKGVDREIIDIILRRRPDKIIYISCNPATQARDIGMLIGTINMESYKTQNPLYKISFVQPYDMFPQTKHVETLVCLTKKI